MLLVRVTDVVADVEAGIDLLAWIEDVFWVKNVFGDFEYLKHLLGVHQMKVGRADDTVVMFSTDATFKLDSCSIKSISHLFYQGGSGFVGEIKERIKVEVSVATVTVNS
jgi:hypothetical protein